MTEPLDYTGWTFDDHLAEAVKLAAQADTMASPDKTPSQAALRREDIRQTAARGLLHATIAELKKPERVAVAAAPGSEAAVSPAKPASTTTKPRARQSGLEEE